MSAHVGEVIEVHAVAFAQNAEVIAKTRPFGPPATDADVDVIALGEDPPVAARHSGELEHEGAAPRAEWEPLVRKIPLERDAVDDRAAEPEPLRGRPVRSVGADDRLDADAVAVDAELAVGLELDARAVPEGRAGFLRLLDEICVQSAPLRHQAESLLRPAFQHAPVLQTAPDPGDAILDDGLHRERELPHGAHRQPPAAGLVAREPRFVY